MYLCTKFKSIWRTSDFGTKFGKKNMNGKKFGKTNSKIVQAYSNVPLHEISVYLKNFRFWN